MFTSFLLIPLLLLPLCWAGARLLSNRYLGLAGRYSYGMYVWHTPAFFVVVRYVHQGWMVRVALGLALASVLTGLSWVLVERPSLTLKDRWGQRRRDRGIPVAGPIAVVD